MAAPRTLWRRGEESPGSTETRCRITSGGGDSRESATESKPPIGLCQARLKWCGKSAPRPRQRRRHGKPHREQDQIGTAMGVFGRCPGRSREAFGNECPRGMAISRFRENRTRLTGHLTRHLFRITIFAFVSDLFFFGGEEQPK